MNIPDCTAGRPVYSQEPKEYISRLTTALRTGTYPIIVTGGGGWLGSVTLNLLDRMLGPDFNDRVKVFGSQARMFTLSSGRQIAFLDIAALVEKREPSALWLHYACLTKDRVAGEGVTRFMARNEEIRELVALCIERSGAYGMFLPSSGAVYGPDRTTDPDVATNPYGATKRIDERRFSMLAATNGMRLIISRVFNVAGPFINKPEAYAIASFLSALLAKKEVTVRARGLVFRSYVHVEDLILLVLGALVLMPSVETLSFDTQGEETIEVEALARRSATLLGRSDTVVKRVDTDSRPDDMYVGQGDAMRVLAEKLGLCFRSLDTQILDTAAYLQAMA